MDKLTIANEMREFDLKNRNFYADLTDGPKSDCVYFVKDISRNCEIVDYNKAW